MEKKFNLPGWPGLDSSAFEQAPAHGFDFFQKMWGALPTAIPGFVVPTVNLEELDQRIKDLKAVESWLNVNTSMLRASIQGLEVQRNTIAAIQSMDLFKSAATAQSAQAAAEAQKTPSRPPQHAAPDQNKTAAAPDASTPPSKTKPQAATDFSATAWLNFLQDQFDKVAAATLLEANAPQAAAAPESKLAKSKAAPAKSKSKTTRSTGK